MTRGSWEGGGQDAGEKKKKKEVKKEGKQEKKEANKQRNIGKKEGGHTQRYGKEHPHQAQQSRGWSSTAQGAGGSCSDRL